MVVTPFPGRPTYAGTRQEHPGRPRPDSAMAATAPAKRGQITFPSGLKRPTSRIPWSRYGSPAITQTLEAATPKTSCRLSDITLQWMLHFITERLPENRRVAYNQEMLRLFPSVDGMMHDECRAPEYVGRRRSATCPRTRCFTPVSSSDFDRRKRAEYSGFAPYRPEQLRHHKVASSFYTATKDPRGRAYRDARCYGRGKVA